MSQNEKDGGVDANAVNGADATRIGGDSVVNKVDSRDSEKTDSQYFHSGALNARKLDDRKSDAEYKEAIGAVDAVVRKNYPNKTVSATPEGLVHFRRLLAMENPEVNSRYSDEELEKLTFAVGGSFIRPLRTRGNFRDSGDREGGFQSRYSSDFRGRSYRPNDSGRSGWRDNPLHMGRFENTSGDRANASMNTYWNGAPDMARPNSLTDRDRWESDQTKENSYSRSNGDAYVDNVAPSDTDESKKNETNKRGVDGGSAPDVERNVGDDDSMGIVDARAEFRSRVGERNYDDYGPDLNVRNGDDSSARRFNYSDQRYGYDRFRDGHSERRRDFDRDGARRYSSDWDVQDEYEPDDRSYRADGYGRYDRGGYRQQRYGNDRYYNGRFHNGYSRRDDRGWDENRLYGRSSNRYFPYAEPDALSQSQTDSRDAGFGVAHDTSARSSYGEWSEMRRKDNGYGRLDENESGAEQVADGAKAFERKETREKGSAEYVALTKPYVNIARDILDKYFPGRQIRGEVDFARFRQHMSMAIESKNLQELDPRTLQYVVSYAGGNYVEQPNMRSFASGSDFRTRLAPHDSGFSTNTDPSPKERMLISGVENILAKYFPEKIVFLPEGFEDFKKLLDAKFNVKFPDDTVMQLLVRAGARLLEHTSENDAYVNSVASFEAFVDVAKRVLKKYFAKATFHSDMSDFKRFRIRFEEEVGIRRIFTDKELCEYFTKAGGVFVERTQAAVVEASLPRAAVIRKIISEVFLNGFDPESAEDLKQLRVQALSLKMDFSGTTDEKLVAAVSRVCVFYDERYFFVSDKIKEHIKEHVTSLFKMGMRMIYFETFYQRNKQWLSGTCITHPLILKSFLAKFYSSYLFYDEYMEKDEDDDVRDENEESDRVKVEKEIKRVWGSYFSLMSDTIAARLCIPERRIVKAMELNTASFKVNDSGYYTYDSSADESVLDAEKLDELFDQAVASDVESVAFKSEDSAPKPEAVAPDSSPVAFESRPAISEPEIIVTDPEVFASESARRFIKAKVDSWFDEGGLVIYYEAFYERHREELTSLGITDLDALATSLHETYLDYYFYEEYFEKEENEAEDEEKIKAELTRVWSEATPARRTVDLVAITYITKDALFDFLSSDPDFECRSNGYWVRVAKKIPGAKRSRVSLKQRRRSRKLRK